MELFVRQLCIFSWREVFVGQKFGASGQEGNIIIGSIHHYLIGST